eukprot:gene25417-biopygen11995
MGGGLWVMGYVWWVVGCSATVACVHWERRRRRVPKKDAYFQEAIDRLEGRLQIWYGISAEDEWGGVAADLWNIRPTHRNWDIASARRALRCVLCTYVCTVHCVMCVGEVWPVSMIGNMSANGKLRYVCVTCVGYVIRGNALSPLHPPAAGWSGAAICSSVSPSRATWSSGLGSGTSTTASTAGNRLLPARTASTLCVVCYGLRLHCVLWVVCYGSCGMGCVLWIDVHVNDGKAETPTSRSKQQVGESGGGITEKLTNPVEGEGKLEDKWMKMTGKHWTKA